MKTQIRHGVSKNTLAQSQELLRAHSLAAALDLASRGIPSDTSGGPVYR